MKKKQESHREPQPIDGRTLAQALDKDLGVLLEAAPRLLEEGKAGRLVRFAEGFLEIAKLSEVAKLRIDGLRAERKKQLDDRAESLRGVVAQREQRLEAFAKRRRVGTPPQPGRFVVAGRVTDKASGLGLPNVTVRAFDLDRKVDDPLGRTRTDPLGYYRIEYGHEDFKDRDQIPELYIQVLGPKDEVIFTSRECFVKQVDASETIDAEVDGSKLPASLALGEIVSRAVDKRLEAFANRRQVLDGRKVARLEKSPAISPQLRRALTRKRAQRSVLRKKVAFPERIRERDVAVARPSEKEDRPSMETRTVEEAKPSVEAAPRAAPKNKATAKKKTTGTKVAGRKKRAKKKTAKKKGARAKRDTEEE